MTEKTDLQFRPIHQGLGFHPFSDGLPYAPAVPTKRATAPVTSTPAPVANASAGSGATLAGPVRSALQLPTLPSPMPRPAMPAPRTLPAATAPAAAVSTATTPGPRVELNFGWTYPIARIFAFCFDTILHVTFSSLAVATALAFADLEPWFLLEPGLFGMTVLFLALSTWSLFTAQEVAFGTTLGKRLVGLRLRGTSTAIFLRAFFFVPSLGFAGAGILWALFDRNRRCWHDTAVDLQPTRITQL